MKVPFATFDVMHKEIRTEMIKNLKMYTIKDGSFRGANVMHLKKNLLNIRKRLIV